jgi:phosphohistidine phosphatase SixA
MAGQDVTQGPRSPLVGGDVLVLMRHADAGKKRRWTGDDALRPLSLLGRQQAVGLLDAMRDLDVRRIISSPLVRCQQTVEPLAHVLRLTVALSANLRPDATLQDLDAELLQAGDGTVLCTHREGLTRVSRHWQTSGEVDMPGRLRWDKGGSWLIDDIDHPGHPAPLYLPPQLGPDGVHPWTDDLLAE